MSFFSVVFLFFVPFSFLFFFRFVAFSMTATNFGMTETLCSCSFCVGFLWLWVLRLLFLLLTSVFVSFTSLLFFLCCLEFAHLSLLHFTVVDRSCIVFVSLSCKTPYPRNGNLAHIFYHFWGFPLIYSSTSCTWLLRVPQKW